MPKVDRKSQEEIYKDLLIKHGVCLECGEMFSHDINEPFAHCGCCTSEWHDFTPYQKLQYDLHKYENESAALINALSTHIQGELIRQVRDDFPTVSTVKREADQLIRKIASKSFDTLEQVKIISAKQALQNLLDATCPASGPMIKDEDSRKSIQEQIDRL